MGQNPKRHIADDIVMTGTDVFGRPFGTWAQAKDGVAATRADWLRRAAEIERRLAEPDVPPVERDELETELESLRTVIALDTGGA